MSCGCINVYYDDSVADFYREKIIKARKVHKCCECSKEIQRGEQYERIVGKWDGDMYTYKTCMDCVSIRKTFFCNGWIFEHMYEDVREHIFDMGGNISSGCLTKLTRHARNEICDMIEEYWERYEDDD